MARFLVVDDEENLRYSLRLFLQGDGHEVSEAAGFDQAVVQLSKNTYDVIFADILLAGKSGLELLKHCKQRKLTGPVVMITGEPSVKTAAEAVRLGAFDYVPKPINRDAFLRMANAALRHKTLDDQNRALEAERNRLRLHLEAVFRSVPDAIITVDKEGRILQTNQHVETILGLPPASLEQQECQTGLGDRYDTLSAVVMQTLRTRKPVREYRVEYTQSRNRERTLVLNSAPLMDAAGEFIGAVLVVRDISLQAGLERQLTERRSYQRMVGKSPPMREIFGLIEDLGETDTTVLITGPSGTGKELVAQALHHAGARSTHPLIKVNCSALSENLLESELFGHVRGAFTGAIKDKPGRFALAHGGTIFLDEVGDISSRIQLKLLRVLQEKEFESVGDTRTIKVDVRVIAATNQNLREKVAMGEFREDLFYRLKVVEISLPPLRERRQDIPLLIEHFMGFFNRQFNRGITDVNEEARTALMQHPWPGNIRELKHAIEHAFILCRGETIELRHLPVELRQGLPNGIGNSRDGVLTMHELQQALETAGGNKAKAARALNVSRQTVYRKLREYNM